MRRSVAVLSVVVSLMLLGNTAMASSIEVAVGESYFEIDPGANGVFDIVASGSTSGPTKLMLDFLGGTSAQVTLLDRYRTGNLDFGANGTVVIFEFEPQVSGARWNLEARVTVSGAPNQIALNFVESWNARSFTQDSALVNLAPPSGGGNPIPDAGTPPPGPAVPEPNAALAFGAGFALIGWASRTRRNR